ncbi:MAG TPA: universal stress protein [Lysobacter sp.]|nr:universal stress protein [Lysobacter sp.]
MKILLAVDGSENSTRAAQFVVKLAKNLAEPPKITLLHVDPPLLQAVSVKLGAQGTQDYHADNSRYALKGARAVLTRGKLQFEQLALVDDADKAIIKISTKQRADMIVMGSRGLNALSGLFMGSLTTKVVAQSGIPVTVVR